MGMRWRAARRGRRIGSGTWLAGVLLLVTARGLEAHQSGANEGKGTGRVPVTATAPPVETAGATAAEGLGAFRTEARPQIDGRLDESVWSRADYAHAFVQQMPDEGSQASEATEVRVLVDGDAFYVGARLVDRNAEGIVARLARRDEAVVADWFYVYLDSYHDRRTAFAFAVSAAGVQRDLRIAEDDREDPAWDAVWESEVKRDADGWTVEMRIPLSQLRFNAAEADTRWGLNFRRDIARKNETSHWASVPQGSDRFVSLFGELRGLDGLKPSRGVEVLPHAVARLTREPGSANDPFYRTNNTFGSVGATARVGLGSSLTLSAAINPDFGQVEADPATVNLTAFETFQSERRPFFVEGSDIFTLSFPFWPPFFHSRRIGRSPQGFGSPDAVYQDRPSATTILGALKISGKTDNGWSVGVLDAVTAAGHLRFVDGDGTLASLVVEPRTNYSVGRVAKEFRNGASGVGAIVTAVHRQLGRTGLDFLHSSAYGFGTDAFHRFRDGEYVTNLSVLGSHVRGSTRAIRRTQRAAGHYFQRPDAEHLEYDPTRTSLTGVSVSGRVQRVRGNLKWGLFGEATSPGYEINDLGFNPTLDRVSVNAWLRYENFTPGRVFRNWSLGSMTGLQRGWDGQLRELTGDLGFSFQLENYWGGGIWVMRHRPSWSATALRGGPALRRPGRWMGSINVNSDRRRDLSGNAFVFWTTEDETGGYTIESSASLTLRLSNRFDLRVGPTVGVGFSAWQYVDRPELAGGPLYVMGALDRRTVGVSTRMNYAFSPHLSLQLYARPFIASGTYTQLREVTDPRARLFDERFRTYSGSEITREDGLYRIDRDADGEMDVSLPDPSFNVASLQITSVLRWEYRSGSTLFVVWTQDRDQFGQDPLTLGESLSRLRSAPARSVFQLKLSYWMGM